ncbi:MAG: heavy metal translocating P-type ATPase, partial [Clostridiales bacterium]
MTRSTLKISGMSCAACSARIEKVLGRLPGVETAAVNLMAAKAVVNYDESKISITEVKAAIINAGFGIEEASDPMPDKPLYSRSTLTIAVCVSLALMYLSMGQQMWGWPVPVWIDHQLHPLGFALVQLVLTCAVLICGRRFYLVGYPALFRRSPNMDSLVALGTSAAFLYSIYGLIKIAQGEQSFVSQLYFETAAMIVTLVLVGKFLEERAKGRANSSLQKLLNLAPDQALIETDAGEQSVLCQMLQPGDIVIVKPGARLPVDGTVIEGESSVDESFLTGESLPRDITLGSQVKGGTVNGAGFFKFRADKVGEDTMLAQIARLMEEAEGAKAPISRLADQVAGIFVPTVLVIAVVAAVIWLIAGEDLTFCLSVFIAVMVIACPCALGLATPTAITVAMGKGAELGILIKSGSALEHTAHVNTLALDKTGTITQGKPALIGIALNPDGVIEEEQALQWAASLEAISEHPLATAIKEGAAAKSLTMLAATQRSIHPGRGISAVLLGKERLFLGNQRFLQEQGIATAILEQAACDFQQQGCTMMYLANAKQILAALAVADQIKPDNPLHIAALRRDGYRVYMLTGD